MCEFCSQVLMFDTVNGRTCLHYAAYYGHFSCLKAILSSAQYSPVAASWFVPFSVLASFRIDYDDAMILSCYLFLEFRFPCKEFFSVKKS